MTRWRAARDTGTALPPDTACGRSLPSPPCPAGEEEGASPAAASPLYISAFMAGVGIIRFPRAGGVMGGAETNRHNSKKNNNLGMINSFPPHGCRGETKPTEGNA